MKNYNTTQVFVAACAGIAFFGVAMLSLGPILGQLNQIIGEEANTLPSTLSIGIIIGTILFGPIVDRFGYKYLTIIASILALAGVQGLAQFHQIELLHLSIASLGVGSGILNGLTNAVVADIYDDNKRAGHMGVLGAFYCIGALLWTLLNYFIEDYHIPLNATSILMGAFVIYFCCIRFPQAKPAENIGLRQTLGLLKYPVLLLFAFALFFQSGFEGASGSFSVEFLKNTASVSHKQATLAMTWFTIGMMAGRFPIGLITARIKELKTLFLYLSIGLVGVILFAFASSALMAYLAMALIGFGVGATFPVVLTYIGGAFRQQSGTAISIAILIALTGQYTFNAIVGGRFAAGQYGILPYMLIGALIVIMILVPLTLQLTKKQNN